MLINAPYPAAEVWDRLPEEAQRILREREIEFWSIDAYALANELELGPRINTIMQACFFALTDILPQTEAMDHVRDAIRSTYGGRGEAVVRRNSRRSTPHPRGSKGRKCRTEGPYGPPRPPAVDVPAPRRNSSRT